MPEARSTIPRSRRLFSAFYDSVTQRDFRASAIASDAPRVVAEAILISRMRLDIMLSGQIVLTDAQLLDGGLFASTTPAELEKSLSIALWQGPSVVVRHRGTSLATALLGLLGDADGVVKPFEFSLLAEEPRSKLKACLEDAEAKKERAPQSVAEIVLLLERAKIDPTDIRRLVEHWERWIDHVDNIDRSESLIAVEEFNSRKLDMAHALSLHQRELPSWAEEVWAVRPGAGAFIKEAHEGLAAGMSRTALYSAAERAVKDEYGAVLVRDYIDRVYGFAFTVQHGCEDFAATWRLPIRPVHTKHESGGGSRRATLDHLADIGLCEIEMPSDFLARLALTSSESLRVWAARHAESLSMWRNEEDRGAAALKDAMEDLEDLLDRGVEFDSVRLEYLKEEPVAKSRSRSAILATTFRRYAPVKEVGTVLAGAVGFEQLTEVVSIFTKPVREGARQALGNPAILTTDIALPRQGAGRALTE